MVATDLSDGCMFIIDHAAGIAAQNNAKLSVIHVAPNISYYMASGLSSIADIELRLMEKSKQRLYAIKNKIEYVADYILLHGNASQEILRHSRDANIDLIVIGSHGHRGMQRLLGSTSDNVCHCALCDVLLVRTKIIN